MKHLQTWARGAVRLALAASLPACAFVQPTTGTYTETHGPGVVLCAGRTLQLFDNKMFTYSYWSDDVSSRHYGSGTYQWAGNRLHLYFGPSLPIVARATARPIAGRSDTLVAFEVRTSSPTRAVAHAAIAAHNEQGKLVAAVASDTAGRAVLRVPGGARWLSVQSLGLVSWRQPCPPGSTAYNLELPPSPGTAYAAGSQQIFRLERHPAANTLVLKRGGARLVFNREPDAP